MFLREKIDRNAAMVSLASSGLTQDAIALEFGISRNRVQQILSVTKKEEERISSATSSGEITELSTRARNVLRFMDVRPTPEAISKLTKSELLGRRNCSKFTVREIETALAVRGMALASVE